MGDEWGCRPIWETGWGGGGGPEESHVIGGVISTGLVWRYGLKARSTLVLKEVDPWS